MKDVANPPISREDVANAGLVVPHVRLAEILLRDSSCAWLGPSPIRDGTSLNIAAEYDATWTLVGDRLLVVTLKATARGTPVEQVKAHAKASSWISVDVAFDLFYQFTIDPPPEELRDKLLTAFATVNGALNGWPYVREFVDNTVRRIGVSRGTLPLFRIPKFPPVPKTDP